MVKACGFDAFYVDREHGGISADACSQICIAGAALGLLPLVRVQSQAARDIAAALDGGAQGVIVPHVDDAAQARDAVRHAKYPPQGERSIASVGPATGYLALPLAESLAAQNDATIIVAMLETAQAIEQADAIAAVPGVDVLMIGPNDLSAAMGVPGQTRDPRVVDAYRAVAAACRRHGKQLAGGGAGGPPVSDVYGMGARLILGGSDVGYLIAAGRRGVDELRAGIGSAA